MSRWIRLSRAVVRALRSRLAMRMDPAGYARSLGVQLGADVHFYEMRPGMFSPGSASSGVMMRPRC